MRSFRLQTNINYIVALHSIIQRLRAANPETRQLRRLRAVMLAATQRTRHYEQYSYDVRRAKPPDILDCLRGIEPVALVDYLKHSDRYRNPKAWSFGRVRLRHMLQHSPRTAIFSNRFLPGIHCRTFPNPWIPALSRFEPEVVAGPVDTLRMFAEAVLRGSTWIPPLRYAVIPFTGILEGPLASADRDLFWRAFGVPAYEQFFGFGMDMLATECEAHAGLHISRDAAYVEHSDTGEVLISFLANPHFPILRLASGMEAEWNGSPCECGSLEPRIVNLHRRARCEDLEPQGPPLCNSAQNLR
jgi:hypothetical protein